VLYPRTAHSHATEHSSFSGSLGNHGAVTNFGSLKQIGTHVEVGSLNSFGTVVRSGSLSVSMLSLRRLTHGGWCSPPQRLAPEIRYHTSDGSLLHLGALCLNGSLPATVLWRGPARSLVTVLSLFRGSLGSRGARETNGSLISFGALARPGSLASFGTLGLSGCYGPPHMEEPGRRTPAPQASVLTEEAMLYDKRKGPSCRKRSVAG